jgi:ferredoxin
MARSEVWFETPPFREDYQLALVEGSYLAAAVKPKQYLHIDQTECILCEGCVDICPWKCIHYLSIDAIAEATNVDDPRDDNANRGFFVVDEDECTRCAICVDRCPTGVISLGKYDGSLAAKAGARGARRRQGDRQRAATIATATYGVRW